MKYRFEISSVAEAEADGAFLRMSQLTSPERASRWYEGLLKAIKSLSEMPKRCPLARENDYFTKELKKFGSSSMVEGATHTVSFSLIVEGEDVSTVRILHIRHAAQQTLGESQESGET